jgi:hypothetical protein
MPEFIFNIFWVLFWWKTISGDESRDDYVTLDNTVGETNGHHTSFSKKCCPLVSLLPIGITRIGLTRVGLTRMVSQSIFWKLKGVYLFD